MLKPNYIKNHNFINILLKKKKILFTEKEKFVEELKKLSSINKNEREENQKTFIRDFLTSLFDYRVNTVGDIDWAILNELNKVEVIIEVKRIKNDSEMVTKENFLKKAFYETILYFMRERLEGNISLKHIIITNIHNWFIIDASEYERVFWSNKKFRKSFLDWHNKKTLNNKTDFFYNEIAKPFCEQANNSQKVSLFDTSHELIDFTSFNIQKMLHDNSERNFNNVYKLLSADTLLKDFSPNDGNSLNKNFYDELLYILGLEEQKNKNKKRIIRAKKEDRQEGSFYENIYSKLDRYGKLSTDEEENFNKVISLIIIWLNRIIFLKLFENQLVGFSKNEEYLFLKKEFIKDFDEFDELFFSVLSKKHEDRPLYIKNKYQFIPYLNSSLFEESDEEKKLIFISQLDSTSEIKFYKNTVLKNKNGKKLIGSSILIEYLYDFLNAYSFGSFNNVNTIEEQHKELINSSVLGLIFEKINGYRDGSFYTPSYITTYMAKNTLEKIIIDKFNMVNKWNCHDLDDLYEKIEDKKEANEIIDSIKICDPAVGSGHYLVSMLNEIIKLKSDLGILLDKNGKKIRDYKILIENDDLAIKTIDNEYFTYQKPKMATENHTVQETIFLEKQKIIENCLFGVDINPNSVNICRLRLWIELLKHTYYTEDSDFQRLQTLPNIDINIKNGNSLLSKFSLIDNENIPKSLKEQIERYKELVKEYKNTNDKGIKSNIKDKIIDIKNEFISDLKNNSKNIINLKKLLNGYTTKKEVKKGYVQQFGYGGLTKDIVVNFTSDTPNSLFDVTSTMNKAQLKEANKIRKQLLKDINRLYSNIKSAENNKIYKDAFEWRLEFPEILDDSSTFIGFDIIIGNPPYIMEDSNKEAFVGLSKHECYQGKTDIWHLFVGTGLNLLSENGLLSYIAKNQWLDSASASNMRKVIYRDSNIQSIIDFGSNMIFDEAQQQTMILLLKKDKKNIKHDIEYIHFDKILPKEEISEKLLNSIRKAESRNLKSIPKDYSEFKNLKFSSEIEELLLNKIENFKNFEFNEKKEITQGIIGGKDDYFIIKNSEINNYLETEKKYIKRFHTNTQRYYTPEPSQSIFYLTKYNCSDINEFPNIFNKLSIHQNYLENRREALKGSISWFHLWWARDESFFREGAKIIWAKRTKGKKFTFTEEPFYGTANLFFIKSERVSLKYITALLNSRLMYFYMQKRLKHTGDLLQIDKNQFMKIPLFVSENMYEFDNIVDKIMENKKNNLNTLKLEKSIDEKFYQMYNLTESEIKIIEECNN